MILQKMAVHVVLQGPIFEFQFYSISNIKSLSLKQQFYLPGLIPPPSQQVKYSTMSRVSPLDFQGLVSSFYYHSINDSLDTISCVKSLVKAWLKKLRASTWKRYFYSYFTMKWTGPYIFVVCATKSLKDLNNCGRSLAASSNFKKRVK